MLKGFFVKLIKTITVTVPLIDYPLPIYEEGVLVDFTQMEIDVMEGE